MATLTDTQIAAIVKASAFPAAEQITAVAICLGESRGNPEAFNASGKAYGLYQIRPAVWPFFAAAVADGTWSNPTVNAAAAYRIWQSKGWTMWTSFNNGSYLAFMARATAAVTDPVPTTLPPPPDPAALQDATDDLYAGIGAQVGLPDAPLQGGKMTNVDKLNEGARLMVGFPYQLGYESNPAGVANSAYDVGDPAGSDPKKGDCSGDVWALWVYSGVHLNGKLVTKADRHTAATYYRMATVKLSQPQLPGDLTFLAYSDGTIHHVGIYLGNGQIFQMGDGTGHASIGTVAYWNGRSGVRYARIPGFDWATVAPVPTPQPGIDLAKLPSLIYPGGKAVCVDGKTKCPLIKIVAGIQTDVNATGNVLSAPIHYAQWKLGLSQTGKWDAACHKKTVALQKSVGGFQNTGRVGPGTWKVLIETKV